MTFEQVAIFVSIIVASALTICWAVFQAAADIHQAMDELNDEIRKESRSGLEPRGTNES